MDIAGDRGSGVHLCGKERAMVLGAMVNVGGCMFISRWVCQLKRKKLHLSGGQLAQSTY
jgi:hypothetical protein